MAQFRYTIDDEQYTIEAATQEEADQRIIALTPTIRARSQVQQMRDETLAPMMPQTRPSTGAQVGPYGELLPPSDVGPTQTQPLPNQQQFNLTIGNQQYTIYARDEEHANAIAQDYARNQAYTDRLDQQANRREDQSFEDRFGEPKSFWQSLQQTLQRRVDPAMQTFFQGATLGASDELGGLIGKLRGDDYAQSRDAIRQTVQQYREDAPYTSFALETLGNIGTGVGASRAGMTLMNPRVATVPAMALRGAGEGAIYGGIQGVAGSEAPSFMGRLGEGLQEAGAGAAFGAPLGAVGGVSTLPARRRLSSPSVGEQIRQNTAAGISPEVGYAEQTLRPAKNQLYNAVEQAHIVYSQPAIQNLITRIQAAAVPQGTSLDPGLFGHVIGALNTAASYGTFPRTLSELDELRQVIRGAAQTPAESQRVGDIIAEFDRVVAGFGPNDVIAGNMAPDAAVTLLNQARAANATFMKANELDQIANRIYRRDPNESLAEAVRREFRNLSNSPDFRTFFNFNEQNAVLAAARGGATERTLSRLSSIAPVGSLLHFVLGFGSIPAAVRRGESALANNNMLSANLVVRNAGQPIGGLNPQLANILRSIIIARPEEYDTNKSGGPDDTYSPPPIRQYGR